MSFKFCLGCDIGAGRDGSCNSVVLLNQLNNAYKYVTNSGLSSRISPKYEEPICLTS